MNLRLIDCQIESLQGLCYINDLQVENCRFRNTTLALEYSTGTVSTNSAIDSVFNPAAMVINAARIGEVTLDDAVIDSQPDGDATADWCVRLHRATGVRVSPGSEFGLGGEGYIRVNIACPAHRVRDAFERIRSFACDQVS